MITQCSIRHLYTADGPDAATKNAWIDTAKSFERRRCNHHTLEEPLSTLECLTSVVDPKGSGTNKNRYVVASQDQKVRSTMRQITGVPLIYVNRSVMVMEPMAAKTEDFREAEEMGKVRAGLKGRRGPAPDPSLKRKREDEDEEEGNAPEDTPAEGADAAPKKKAKKGPKGPNPLSVKKSKKKTAQEEQEKQAVRKAAKSDPQAMEKAVDADVAISDMANDQSEAAGKKKRRRKHKSTTDGAADPADGDDAPATAMEIDA